MLTTGICTKGRATPTSASYLQDAIATALKGDLDFKGTYYHRAAYPATNPILNLKGVGRIGLPLNELQAKHIISHCAQAPFGKGDKTLVDKSVRDTWEMDAADVRAFRDGRNRHVAYRSGLGSIRQSAMGSVHEPGRSRGLSGSWDRGRHKQTSRRALQNAPV